MRILAFAVALLSSLPALASRVHRRVTPPPPAVPMTHLSTGERFELRVDRAGRVSDRRELRGLKHFLRCHHTGREHSMSARLASLLWATAHHFGDARIEVVAGYRAPRVARRKGNPRSHHKEGAACDFRLDGVPLPTVRDWLLARFEHVGVGYYPNAGFVHLDVAHPRKTFWIDYSGPGERARYADDPDGALRELKAVEADTVEDGDDPGLMDPPPPPPRAALP